MAELKHNASPASAADENILIYVTGFGLFQKLTSNASWEAVRLLPTEHIVDGIKCSIKLLEIPVVYEDVDRAVAVIWKENPKVCTVRNLSVTSYINCRTVGYSLWRSQIF